MALNRSSLAAGARFSIVTILAGETAKNVGDRSVAMIAEKLIGGIPTGAVSAVVESAEDWRVAARAMTGWIDGTNTSM